MSERDFVQETFLSLVCMGVCSSLTKAGHWAQWKLILKDNSIAESLYSIAKYCFWMVFRWYSGSWRFISSLFIVFLWHSILLFCFFFSWFPKNYILKIMKRLWRDHEKTMKNYQKTSIIRKLQKNKGVQLMSWILPSFRPKEIKYCCS